MNPWDIVSWIAAVCVALIILVVAAIIISAGVRSILNPPPARDRKVRIGVPGQVRPGQREVGR